MKNNARAGFFGSIDLSGLAFGMLWLFIFSIPWEDEVAFAGIAISHVIGALACMLGVFVCLFNRRFRPPNAIHYAAGAFILCSALTWFWSVDPDLTAVKAGSYAQLMVMVWLIWEFARTETRQMSLGAAYVLGSFVAAASTIRAWITGTGENADLVAAGRFTAEGFNQNEIGIILALALGFSCYLLATRKGFRILWLLYVPVGVLAILLTGSRGSTIATVIALSMFPLSLPRFSKSQKIAGGILLVVSIAVALAFVPRTTWERMATIGSELSQGTLTKRTDIWTAGLDVYHDHALLGVGSGAFQTSVYRHLSWALVAHNSYLSVLVETGAIGFLLFAILLFLLFRAAMLLPRGPRTAWLVLLLTWAVAVFSVTWEHRKPTWFLFGLLIAQSASLQRRRQQHKDFRTEALNRIPRNFAIERAPAFAATTRISH